MFLLVYKGLCQSTIVNGVKFTQNIKTANVDDEKAKLFVGSDGKALYDDIEVISLVKAEIVPDPDETKIKKELTVEGLKKENNLEKLQGLCAVRNLSNEGSKTELAERIVGFEGILKANTLEQLQTLCSERELETEGTEAELAVKIITFEEANKS